MLGHRTVDGRGRDLEAPPRPRQTAVWTQHRSPAWKGAGRDLSGPVRQWFRSDVFSWRRLLDTETGRRVAAAGLEGRRMGAARPVLGTVPLSALAAAPSPPRALGPGVPQAHSPPPCVPKRHLLQEAFPDHAVESCPSPQPSPPLSIFIFLRSVCRRLHAVPSARVLSLEDSPWACVVLCSV